jgi:hypothetical protein
VGLLTASWAKMWKQTLMKPKRVPWTTYTADGFGWKSTQTSDKFLTQ